MYWLPVVSLSVVWCAGSSAQHVLTQPPSASVLPGSTAKLPCAMILGMSISAYTVFWYQQKPGNPPRYLLWYNSPSNIHQASGVPPRFSGSKDTASNTCHLTITGALAEDEADYYCAVDYDGTRRFHGDAAQRGSSSSQLSLSQPASASISPGNTVKLPCTMSSGTSIGSYTVYWYQQKPGNPPRYLLWYYSESSKHQGDGVPSRFSGSKDTSSNTCHLTISGALGEDEADYYCAVWHSNTCHSDVP